MSKVLKWQDAPEEMRQAHLLKVYSNGKGWTTEPPTKEGLYRAIDKRNQAVWVNVYNLSNQQPPFVEEFGSDIQVTPDAYSRWLGPLPVPESPKE